MYEEEYRVIPWQVNQIFSTFEPDPLGFFSNLAHHMYHRRELKILIFRFLRTVLFKLQ